MIEQDKGKSQPPTRKDTGTRSINLEFSTVKPDETTSIAHVPSYLSSPLKTIVASTALTSHIPTHDLLDAYHILAIRLKCLVVPLSTSINVTTRPALEPIRLNSASVLQALSRDIQRALAKPSTSAIQDTPSDELPFEWQSSASHAPGAQIKPLEMHYALDSAILCQYALRVVSIIFKFESFHQLFKSKRSPSSYFKTTSSSISSSRPPKHLSLSPYSPSSNAGRCIHATYA